MHVPLVIEWRVAITIANPFDVKSVFEMQVRFTVSVFNWIHCKASGAGRMKNSVAMVNPAIII